MRGRAPRIGALGRTGSKRITRSSWRELVGQGVAIETGRVYREPDEAARYEYVAETGEFLVSVRMDSHQAVVWALWSPGIIGPAFGLLGIPPEGAEVAVGFPDGDYEGDPMILGVTTTGDGLPIADLQDGRLLLVSQQGGEIWAYDGTGTPKKLALKEDVDAVNAFLADQFDTGVGHTHASIGAAPTSGAGAGTGFSIPTAAGTEVLKGK